MVSMVRIAAVRILGARRVELTLTNGAVVERDLAPLLYGPVFERILADDDLFAEVQVDAEFGTLVWPSGADLCPDVLIQDEVV
jgi:hypothetical protein